MNPIVDISAVQSAVTALKAAKRVVKEKENGIKAAVRVTLTNYLAAVSALPGVTSVSVSIMRNQDADELATCYISTEDGTLSDAQKEADSFFEQHIGGWLTIKQFMKWFGGNDDKYHDEVLLTYNAEGHSILWGDDALDGVDRIELGK